MINCCMNCHHYTTEYQGWKCEFIHYCRVQKHQVSLEHPACRNWEPASAEEMSMREKVWGQWAEIVGRRRQ